MTSLLFVLVGGAAGGVHAAWLGRDARRGQRLWSWPLRLLIVGAVLYVGVRTGHLLPTAAGWAAGFLADGLFEWRRPW